MRYIEANPLRAGLVARAQDWKWSSLSHRIAGDPFGVLDPWPLPQPPDWLDIVNEPIQEDALVRLRTSAMRSSDGRGRLGAAYGGAIEAEAHAAPARAAATEGEGDIQNIHCGRVGGE